MGGMGAGKQGGREDRGSEQGVMAGSEGAWGGGGKERGRRGKREGWWQGRRVGERRERARDRGGG